jgi:hypothetical protein
VPLGHEEANKTVRVVVETLEPTASPPRSFADRAEWLRFLDETGGKWQGDFAREPQGDYEERHPL